MKTSQLLLYCSAAALACEEIVYTDLSVLVVVIVPVTYVGAHFMVDITSEELPSSILKVVKDCRKMRIILVALLLLTITDTVKGKELHAILFLVTTC